MTDIAKNTVDPNAIVGFLGTFKDGESMRRYFLRKFAYPDKLSWADEDTDYSVDFLFVSSPEKNYFGQIIITDIRIFTYILHFPDGSSNMKGMKS